MASTPTPASARPSATRRPTSRWEPTTSCVAPHSRGGHARGAQPLVEKEAGARARLAVDDGDAAAGQVADAPQPLGVPARHQKSGLPGGEGHEGDVRAAQVLAHEGHVGLARGRVHHVEAGHVHLAPLQGLEGGQAAHGPGEQPPRRALATQPLVHDVDGGIAARHHHVVGEGGRPAEQPHADPAGTKCRHGLAGQDEAVRGGRVAEGRAELGERQDQRAVAERPQRGSEPRPPGAPARDARPPPPAPTGPRRRSPRPGLRNTSARRRARVTLGW